MSRIARFAMIALFSMVGIPAGRAAEVDNLLPQETEFVIQINVKQLLESDIVKKYFSAKLKMEFEKKEAQKVLTDLGLDPLKDIERVTIGMWGKDKESFKGMFIVRGTFDAKKIMDAAQSFARDTPDKFTIVKEEELELIQFTGSDGKPGYIAVIEGKPIIAGTDKKSVAAAVAAHTDKAKPALGKELAAIVHKQDAKASLFMCGIVEGKITEVPGDFGQLKPLGVDGEKIKAGIIAMKTFGMTANIGAEVKLSMKLGMKDNDSADDFGAEITKLVTAAKTFLPLAAGSKPNYKSLIDDITATLSTVSKDRDIIVAVKLTAAAIGTAVGAEEE